MNLFDLVSRKRADPRPQGAPRHQARRDQGPGHGRPPRRRRHRLLPGHRGGHRRPRGPPRDRPRSSCCRRTRRSWPSASARSSSSTSVVDRIEAAKIIGRMVAEPADARGPGPAPRRPVLRGRPLRPRERGRPPPPRARPAHPGPARKPHDARRGPGRPSRPTAPASWTSLEPALRDDGADPWRSAGPSPRSWPASAPSGPPTSSLDELARRRGGHGAGPRRRALQAPGRTVRGPFPARRTSGRKSSISSGKCCDLVLERASGRAGTRPRRTWSLRDSSALFDLMTLLHPAEDVVQRLPEHPAAARPRPIDYALEHLDTMLDRELKALLLPLIEDLPPEERDARLRRALRLK
ncbi:MAG: hypothetical protein M0C28_21185 [Candidatus Moduliflexus flocculans]|nr:hypothetical protein [Candidatus Moduliflexus flocculans]